MHRTNHAYFLNAMGLCCALGVDKTTVAGALFDGEAGEDKLRSALSYDDAYLNDDRGYYLGAVKADLPLIPATLKRFDSRNNRLLLLALNQIQEEVDAAIIKYGKSRIAVLIGTSTSGIAEGEAALLFYNNTGGFPDGYHFGVQEIADGSEFLASHLGLENLALTVSTACSSSAKVFSHATELMDSGFCDAVLVGGMDSICQMTVNGFHALGALSAERCTPFSQNRDGISIGEGGALFLMTREASGIQLLSVGESSDGYSMTAPEPEGLGAELSMRNALDKAELHASDIAYVNLHGTATPHNDSMESKAVSCLFGDDIACSSSKSLIGHTLGGAGAIETALCWLMLSYTYNPDQKYLPHLWDGQAGVDITLTNFVTAGQKMPAHDKGVYILSNFCAFGGSNASVILKGGVSG